MADVQEKLISVNDELRALLLSAYEAFSSYGTPISLHASPVHDLDENLKDLCSVPLVQPSAEALGPFASSAMTTIAEISDYKYFLPRVLHLAVAGSHGQPGLDPDLIASKLDYANWRQWPRQEQAAIECVYDRAWARARLLHPDREEQEDWLCANAMIGNNVGLGLDDWLVNPTPDSMVQLAHFALGSTSIAHASGFWNLVPLPVRLQIVDWLCGDAVEAALIEGVSHVDENDRWRFDSVEASLSLLRQARWRD